VRAHCAAQLTQYDVNIICETGKIVLKLKIQHVDFTVSCIATPGHCQFHCDLL
jgi:hypothetical protein